MATHRRHHRNHGTGRKGRVETRPDPEARLSRRREARYPAVAPYALVQDDFSRMKLTKRLRTTDDACEWILMQSVEGHAQMGHGAFAGRRFPNTELEDIVEALGRNPRLVAGERQGLIEEVRAWVEQAMNGGGARTLVNGFGDGLMGCGLLRHIEVDPEEVLRGVYLGGLRDQSDLRAEVERRTGAHIGGGRSHFVDVEVMHELGLDGDQLARGAHGDKIESYRQAGLIVPDPGPEAWDDPRIRYLYVRDRVGGGASDDAAVVVAGLLYSPSAALGVFLADAVDTLEKFVLDYDDQDAALARQVEAGFPGLNLSLEDVYRLIWLCHVPPEMAGKVPDSSLRHLLEVDPTSDQTALESHLACVSGHPFSDMALGSEDIPNIECYAWIETRIDSCPASLPGSRRAPGKRSAPDSVL